MQINIDYEIGDPILILKYNQREGWHIICRRFREDDAFNLKNIFKTSIDAEAALKRKLGENVDERTRG